MLAYRSSVLFSFLLALLSRLISELMTGALDDVLQTKLDTNATKETEANRLKTLRERSKRYSSLAGVSWASGRLVQIPLA